MQKSITNFDFKKEVKLKRYLFDEQLVDRLSDDDVIHNWPIVYLISDEKEKEAYVGETTDVTARMSAHLKNNKKNKLTLVHFISSFLFNKSATLDIESNLIKYISGDGQYKLMNANIGVANHNYYQKQEIYWNAFTTIWNCLRSEGIVKHSLESINNSDLFKYSPYKSLTKEQRRSIASVLNAILSNTVNSFVIEGGAGTGKTILAVFLFKLLNSESDTLDFREFDEDETHIRDLAIAVKNKYPVLEMALIVPMSSFRKTLQNVFKNVKGLSPKMVIGPSDVAGKKYDILLVDESHRLRQRVNLGAYYGAFDKACEKLGFDKFTADELDWVLLQSKKLILFYDENQSIKPSDVSSAHFQRLKQLSTTATHRLQSQMRVLGGADYIKFVDDLLNVRIGKSDAKFYPKNYEFKLFDSIDEMVGQIKQRDRDFGLSRVVAGYSWPWISKANSQLNDIKIGDTELKWNSTNIDWVNSPNAINEVGCIHTTQGYDLNYIGVIFGNEIVYDPTVNEVKVVPSSYFDINGKQSIKDIRDLKPYIINIYKTMLLRGVKGAYVYVCDKNLREYFRNHVHGINEKNGISILSYDERKTELNYVPFFDLEIAAGDFSQVQKSDNVKWVEVPSYVKYTSDMFACKVVGNSMNNVIPDGAICLFRKYSGGSRNGLIVLCEDTDIQTSLFGSRYTIKEYQSTKQQSAEGEWMHESIVLKPNSTDSSFRDIILDPNDLHSFKVIGIFDRVIELN